MGGLARDWDATLRANLTGVFLYAAARSFPGMVEQGRGSVVVIGSMTGKRPLPSRTAYAPPSGADRARPHARVGRRPLGVRVNLVSPGPGRGRAPRRRARARRGPAPPGLLAASPLGRFATAGEVAAAVRFLCSDAASAITGEDLNVSAGTVMHG